MVKAHEVSVAFFAYMQEAYVRDSVLSILAQETEEPLEIILSDDGSKDATYSIMEEVVREYSGKHRVVLRRNETNMGLANHINLVLSMCRGNWIMVAAGDDISLPHRAQSIIDLLGSSDDPSIMAVQGGYSEIDPEGNVTGTFPEPPLPDANLMNYVASDGYLVGATMAYRKSFIDRFGPLGANVGFEDRVFGFRTLLSGRVVNLTDVVVLYRRDVATSLTTGDRRANDWSSKLQTLQRKHRGLKYVELQYLEDLKAWGQADTALVAMIQKKYEEHAFYESVFARRPIDAISLAVSGAYKALGIKQIAGGVLRAFYYRYFK